MFRSIYLKTLRDYRIAILGWGIGMGLIIVELLVAVGALLSTPAQRAQLAALASQFAWNADAVRADTPGGYAMWKLGTFIFIVCIWPILAASRTLRGEEESSRLDVLLSAPRGRLRVAIEKVAAIWTGLILIGVIMAVISYLAAVKVNAGLSLGDTLAYAINLSLISMVFGGIALLISQFTRERSTAAGATGGLLVFFILLDMVHRVIPNTDWISRLSPIYYYNLSKALVPSFGTNVGGLAVELALALILTGAGVWLFARRDVSDVVPLPGWLRGLERPRQPSSQLPAGDWSVGSVYARSLGMIAVATFWWSLFMGALAAWLVVLVGQMADQLQKLIAGSPAFAQALSKLGGSGAAFNDNLLSVIFFYMPLLTMAFAVTQVNRWAADEAGGRLEMVLATPQSRQVVILGRFAALTTATVIIGVVSLIAIVVAAALAGIKIDQGNLAAATLGIIPMGLLVAAIGYLGAGWLRTAADTGLLSFILAAWFFITFVGPDLKWPDSALKLSAFYYYGTPIIHGLNVGNLLVVLGVGVAALVLATLRFTRKDIAA